MLLANVLCADAWQRHVHGPNQDAACKKAQDENLVSPFSCASQRMWKEGEVHRVWKLVTESYLMLLAIIVPCLLLTIWMMFWSYNERAARSQAHSIQKEMLAVMNGVVSMKRIENNNSGYYVPKEKGGEYIRLITRGR